MKILILTIATNKYIQFVERLYDNIEDKFLNGHEIQGLLFTEHDVETSDNIKVSQIEHEPWPMPTLKRYNYFIKEKDYISQFDYCYYFDVDMGIVSEVGDEVLSDLVATMHPYQSFYPKEQRTYDVIQSHLHTFHQVKKVSYTMQVDSMVVQPKSLWKWQKFLPIAVSYTHLTLPTIPGV